MPQPSHPPPIKLVIITNLPCFLRPISEHCPQHPQPILLHYQKCVVAVTDRAQQVLDEDYEELLERLRAADFLYTEYSLEEVIYHLAKVMFSQSLTRGERSMQTQLQQLGWGWVLMTRIATKKAEK